jgi:hypothetical protein
MKLRNTIGRTRQEALLALREGEPQMPLFVFMNLAEAIESISQVPKEGVDGTGNERGVQLFSEKAKRRRAGLSGRCLLLRRCRIHFLGQVASGE